MENFYPEIEPEGTGLETSSRFKSVILSFAKNPALTRCHSEAIRRISLP